jgi:hypothetical protein
MEENFKVQIKEKFANVIVKQEEQNEREFIGRLVPHKGHNIYEVNVVEGTIELAEFEQKAFDFNGTNQVGKKSILMKDQCLYVSALNKINACKKILKGRNGSKF